MLKFFRRIRQRLLDNQNLRKYLVYAIGEIALVVIGILIALQINNWNEWEKDRIKEREILEDLQGNIELNNTLLVDNLSFLDSLNSSTDVMLRAISNQQAYSDTLNIHFQNSRKHGFLRFMLSYSGFEAYKNTGFDIIQQKQLKDEIIDLFEVAYSKLDRVYDFIEVESEQTRALLSDYFYYEESGSLVPFDYGRLLKDQKFKALLTRIRANRKTLKTYIQDCRKESEEVFEHIREELGRY